MKNLENIGEFWCMLEYMLGYRFGWDFLELLIMSHNVIKLKKVPLKVSFDLKIREAPIRLHRDSKINKRGKRNITTLPFRPNTMKLVEKKIKTPLRISKHCKTPALAIKTIAADIFNIGRDIEKIGKTPPSKHVENLRRSVTPPSIPGYKITKQSFPNFQIKLPKF